MKFTEAKLEHVFTELLENEGYSHFVGSSLARSDESEVLIEEDLKTYLLNRYQNANLTETEAQSIILKLKTLSSADLYESNKKNNALVGRRLYSQTRRPKPKRHSHFAY